MRLVRLLWAIAALHQAISVATDEDCSWLDEFSMQCAEFWSGAVPPVLLLALGGFRPEYLDRMQPAGWRRKASPVVPTLQCLAKSGISTPYMMPVYPTLTQPNLYSIVTGMYSETHGIVADEFYDAQINATFNPFSSDVNDPRWWEHGDPIWATAKKQGKLSAVDSWPGSALLNDTSAPIYRSPPRGNRSLKERIDQILKWLLMGPDQRPAFIASYFEDAEVTGRVNGPSSNRLTEKIKAIDEQIWRLMDELRKRNVSSCVNIIIVSDHGMTDSSRSELIDVSESMKHLPTGAAVHNGVPVTIRWNSGEISEVDALKESLECGNPHVNIWSKGELPYRMHWARSNRIANVIVDLDLGWRGYSQRFTDATKGGSGWDNLHDDMHAIFIAYGPSFKKRLKVRAFENVHLYNLMCAILEVKPSVNDGIPGALHYLLSSPANTAKKSGSKVSILRLPPREDVYRQQMASLCRVANATSRKPWDQDLRLNLSEEAKLIRLHAPFGVPLTSESSVNRTVVFVNHDYITGFDYRLGIPRWVQYRVRGVNEYEGSYSMRLDLRLPAGSKGTCYRLELQRYREQSPLVHFFPPVFARRVDEAWLETNMMEVSPHVETLLSTVNKLLAETWIEQGPINVISGPTQGLYDAIFYVISRCTSEHDSFVDCPVDNQDVQAFLLPKNPRFSTNCSVDHLAFLHYHVATLNDIERVTGLTFFPELSTQDKLKLLTRTTLESRLLVNPTPQLIRDEG